MNSASIATYIKANALPMSYDYCVRESNCIQGFTNPDLRSTGIIFTLKEGSHNMEIWDLKESRFLMSTTIKEIEEFEEVGEVKGVIIKSKHFFVRPEKSLNNFTGFHLYLNQDDEDGIASHETDLSTIEILSDYLEHLCDYLNS